MNNNDEKHWNVGVVGQGNVAYHLCRALSKKELSSILYVTHINSHDKIIPANCHDTSFDIILLAVSDNAINEVASKIPVDFKGIVAHVSGTTPLSSIPSHFKSGIMYPLMTFSKDVVLNYSHIPIFICSPSDETTDILKNFASLISDNVSIVKEERLPEIHLAGVFACNFTNHLLGISNEILLRQNLDINILYQLIQETIRKAMDIKDPYKTQTGPAIRRDYSTIQRHEEMIKNNPGHLQIYQLITKSIMSK